MRAPIEKPFLTSSEEKTTPELRAVPFFYEKGVSWVKIETVRPDCADILCQSALQSGSGMTVAHPAHLMWLLDQDLL